MLDEACSPAPEGHERGRQCFDAKDDQLRDNVSHDLDDKEADLYSIGVYYLIV